MELPFDHLAVYDRDLVLQQNLVDPVGVVLNLRWGLGTGELTIAGDDPILPLMQQDGARIVARYRGEHALSGWLYERTGDLDGAGDVTFDVYDDGYLLAWTQGWVVPSGKLQPSTLDELGQTVRGSNGHVSGLGDGSGFYVWPADVKTTEAAVKRIIADNFARFPATDLRRRTTILPDQGRGGDPRAAGKLPQVRFDALDEVLAPLLEWANLGIRIWQEPGAKTLSLDVYTPETKKLRVDTASGIVDSGTYKFAGPTGTRGVLGGPGEDVERAFFGFTDTAAEQKLGFGIETFVDATSYSPVWPASLDDGYRVAKYFLLRGDVDGVAKAEFQKYIDSAIAKTLTDQAAKATATVQLAETETFGYGGPTGYHVGDLLPIGTPEADVFERVTGVELAYSSSEDGGFSVTPTVGSSTAEGEDAATAALAYAIQSLALAARRRATRQ